MSNRKPRLLFLDDEQWRHTIAEQRYGQKFVVFHCRTVSQVAACLEGARFDVISLDHDLLGRRTGMDAAKLVGDLFSDRRPAQIIIHSWNLPAAQAMFQHLSSKGYPFVLLQPFEAPR